MPARTGPALVVVAGAVGLLACGSGEAPAARSGSGGAGPGAAAGHAGAWQGGNGGGGKGSSLGGSSGTSTSDAGMAGSETSAGQGGTSDGSLLVARVRRLANAEYDASVQRLLGTTESPTTSPDFPPDFRQDGFTVNGAQRVDAIVAQRLATAADQLASDADANGTLARLAPCPSGANERDCARAFITTFGAEVYRRPLGDDDVAALLALYDVGAEDASYRDGIAHVLRGLLQSAGFLYLTELGDGTVTPDGTARLTPYETAASIAYFLTSAPPDAELLEKAVAGALSDPAEREAQARRLLATDPAAQATAVRLVREWLGIDDVRNTAKDTLVYPSYDGLKSQIVAESSDFVQAVAFQSTGLVSELLGARWTVDSGPLALYQPLGPGPLAGTTALADRVGILNQAAFLATYANAHESHPVFRGVALARRVTCYNLDSPASFNVEVVPPAPDPSKTTRERFAAHVADPICAGCHDIIDPLGFPFEQFDGMGGFRTQENGQDVDSSSVVAMGMDFDGPYADSNALAAALAQSAAVRTCFARYMYRAGAATGDQAATPGEQDFVDRWRSIPAAAQGSIVETLVAYVKNPGFTLRSMP
jgi:hypothetical protein